MRLSDVLLLGKDFLILGIAALVIITIVAFVGYFLVYKLIMKGKKRPSKKSILLFVVTFMYIVGVFGAVFLTRISRDNGSYILYPFYSYREAWNGWSSYGWRGIILNIAMFIPFGVLLPLWSEKLQSFWKVFIISFLFTLFIEGVQYFSGLGLFDVDDLINNTLGGLIGYGIVMVIMALINRRKLKLRSILAYLSPALITVGIFAVIFSLYHFKEFGTLASAYSYPKDMHRINIISDISFSSEQGKAMIYKGSNLSVSEAEDFAQKFFEAIGSRLAEDQNIIYDETGIFYSEDRRHNLWINYRGGTYNYSFLERDLDGETSVTLTTVSEKDLREALSSMNISVPQGASFAYDNEQDKFTFQADLIEESGVIFDGTLRCDYNENGSISDIDNETLLLQPYREVEIISQEEAFSQVMEGKFIWWYGQDSEMQTLTIEDITLDYQLDSKGYYQPVYSFSVSAEENEPKIIIPAVK